MLKLYNKDCNTDVKMLMNTPETFTKPSQGVSLHNPGHKTLQGEEKKNFPRGKKSLKKVCSNQNLQNKANNLPEESSRYTKRKIS